MSFVIPDPRWEKPNLLIPGRKPVGPVQIDWSHPLSERLCHFALADYDVVTQTPLEIPAGITRKTGGLYCGATQTTYINGTTRFRDAFRGATSATLVVRAKAEDYASVDRRLFGFFTATTGQQALIIWLDTGGTGDSWAGGVRVAVGLSLNLGENATSVFDGAKLQTIVLTWDGVTAYLYVDGVLADSGTKSGTLFTTLLQPTIGGLTSLTSVFKGDIEFTAAYNRYLSPREVAEITRNPYQFLIPQ